MRLCSKLLSLGTVLLSSTVFASADTIASSSATVTFAGYTTTAPDPSTLPTGGAATYNLDPGNPMAEPGTFWFGPLAGSSWVGSTPTSGPVGTVNPPKGYYVYDYAFTPSGGAGNYSLSLSVLGDDTVEVVLNGTVLIPFGGLGDDHHCANSAPGCDQGTIYTLPLTNVFFGSSENLSFVVREAGFEPAGGGGTGDPSGLDFVGGFTPGRSGSLTPEPGTLLLLGTGLIGAAGTVYRRLRTRQ